MSIIRLVLTVDFTHPFVYRHIINSFGPIPFENACNAIHALCLSCKYGEVLGKVYLSGIGWRGSMARCFEWWGVGWCSVPLDGCGGSLAWHDRVSDGIGRCWTKLSGFGWRGSTTRDKVVGCIGWGRM